MKFHGLNYYSKQPQRIFDFYKTLGFRVHQEKESDDYFGAALALTDEQEPIMWIWSIPEGKEQPCCNNLYFTTNGKVYEIYGKIKAAEDKVVQELNRQRNNIDSNIRTYEKRRDDYEQRLSSTKDSLQRLTIFNERRRCTERIRDLEKQKEREEISKSLDISKEEIYVGEKIGYTINYYPTNATYKKYILEADDLSIIEINDKKNVVLKEYDEVILDRFNYQLKITPWLNENISQEVLDRARIGYYPGGDQITIPHFDINNRFIGLRGRTLCADEAEIYGKYRPLKINKLLYNHPLGMNLYNLNNSKDNIKTIKKAIVFESEKSTLKYATYFGMENDISVACCGFSISAYQIQLLMDCGAEEIIVAFDRQFKEIGDNEFKKLKANIIKLHNKNKNYVKMSFIFDKNKITNYKDSPIDESKEKFLQLFKERIIL